MQRFLVPVIVFLVVSGVAVAEPGRNAGGLRAPTTNATSAQNATTAAGGGVHYYFLLDRSGSMDHLRGDVIGGFNSYVAKQQADPIENQQVRLTLVQFDSVNSHEVTFDGVRIEKVRPLTELDYSPRGGTPLYDAIGRLIDRASSGRLEEGVEQTVVIIFTDGEENDSRSWDQNAVAELIRGKEEGDGWTFVFLGANQDAFKAGSRVGISRKNTQNYVPDEQGVETAFKDCARASATYNRKAARAYAAAATSVQSALHTPSASGADQAAVAAAMAHEADLTFFEGFDDAQRDFEARSSSGHNDL